MEIQEQEHREKLEVIQKKCEEEINTLADEYQKLKEESDKTQTEMKSRLDETVKKMRDACES